MKFALFIKFYHSIQEQFFHTFNLKEYLRNQYPFYSKIDDLTILNNRWRLKVADIVKQNHMSVTDA